MRRLILLISCLLIITVDAYGEESIRVLMQEDPDAPLPSVDVWSVGHANGNINGVTHSGNLEVLVDKNVYIIEMPIEDYVEGVVYSESGKDWGIEALKAQAVISRTYAMFYKEGNRENVFHLTSSVLHQVYKGENNNPLIKRAVEETRGEILTYDNKPINALYHSICIGKTELPEEVWGTSYPYLKSVDCNAKDTPYDNWQRRFSSEKLGNALGIEEIKGVEIMDYTATGRAETLMFKTAESSIEVKATELRKILGYKELPSTDFSVKMDKDVVVFEGRGWGHGVGLSQWGAQEMAKSGMDYKEILRHYYPGTTLKRLNAG